MAELRTEAQMRKLRADAIKESSIEIHFTRTARKYGCKQRKLTSIYAPDGWPDRVLVWPDGKGTTDWVELKRPKGGRYQPKQLQIHAELRSLGCRVEVISTKSLVNEYFAMRALELGVKVRKAGSKAGLARLKQLQLSSV